MGGSVDVIIVLVWLRQPRKSHEIKANGYCFDVQDVGWISLLTFPFLASNNPENLLPFARSTDGVSKVLLVLKDRGQ